MSTLVEWLGSGGHPVDEALSNVRAVICETCPENRSPRWWELHKDPIAFGIKKLLEVKNQMKLKVSNEDELHMCRVCGCCIPLKVHVPMQHILSTSKPQDFPEHCWIRKGIW